LPRQASPESAKEFAEKMLTRWVAKRGLLFKAHIVVTDAMKEAGLAAVQHSETGEYISSDQIADIIKAALDARG
jgi:hypothetical protein